MAYTRIQHRRGTTVQWNQYDPVLGPGEIGVDLTTKRLKIGTGSLKWSELTFFDGNAYDSAVSNGFVGTEQEWLDSLSGYGIAVEEGFEGTKAAWLDSLVGPPANISAGTTTTGDPGTSASFELTGTAPDYTINFTIPQGLQGEQGIQGETGPIGPTGATGIEWKGEWDETADYVDNDAVFWNGTSWFASGDPIIGEEPTDLADHWYPLALQGATGPQGIQGLPGDRYSTTSSTSLDLSTITTSLPTEVSVTLAETGLAYSVGQDVIIAYDISNYIKGAVTSHASESGSLSILATEALGAVAASQWSVNLQGVTLNEILDGGQP